MKDEANTSKPKNGGNDYLYSPREGKTNEYRSGTSKSKQGHQYII